MLRLYKLSISGALLDKKSRALADEVTPDVEAVDDERDEFLSWHGEARWIGDEEFAPRNLLQGSVANIVAAFEEEEVSPNEFRGLVVQKRVKVASALRRLAKQGKWPANYWQGFLWHLAEPRERSERLARLHNHVARILAEAPEELCKEVESAVTGFVNRLAEEYGTERETEFGVLWTKAWNSKGEGVQK